MEKDRNVFAETAIVSLALTDPNALLDILAQVQEEDFIDQRNRLVYSSILRLHEQKKSIDPANLLEDMTSMNTLEEGGGEAYVANLLTQIPSRSELPQFIETVKNRAVLRKFVETCKEIVKKADEKIDSIPDFIGSYEKTLNEIAGRRAVAGFEKTGDILKSYLSKLEENSRERILTGRNPYVTGVSSGYSSLDRLTGGFHKGDLIILAARPSVGKTAIAINFAINAAIKGVTTAFFSLEMRNSQIVARMLCNRSNLSTQDIVGLNFVSHQTEQGTVYTLADRDKDDPEAKARMKNLKMGIQTLVQCPIFIDDKPGSKVVAIEAQVKKLQTSHPDLGLVVIDYLTLISSATNRTSAQDNRQSIVSDISRALKGLARDLDIPVIVLSQLSRAPEKRTGKGAHEPVLSDLRDSGAIEQDADQVFLLYRPDYYGDENGGSGTPDQGQDQNPDQNTETSLVKLIVAKNRNGPIGDVQFVFNKARCQFNETVPDEIENTEEIPEPQGF